MPEWPKFDPQDRDALMIQAQIEVERNYEPELYKEWQELQEHVKLLRQKNEL